MSKVDETLQELASLDGFIACALVDYKSGMCLGTAGNTNEINLEIAAAGNSEVIKAKGKVMQNLGLKDQIEDILITLGNQYHLIRMLNSYDNLFIYLVTGKNGNLAMARHKLTSVEQQVQV